ncbi:MAG: FCD domain-containing protein [Actinobacteria bacterium]|nr:FCD domain-containing protein [Actinomycetota bacterium]MSY38070.1 FCD domain-containing protein [Actinomycetota bacterium]MSZ40914.1 FCD domain-containing protein [Actinomycetota bacterium]
MSIPSMSQQAHRPSGRMSAQVYELLKGRLVSGEFAPESWIRVESLKVEYGVSKQPIMDALRMLNADGLVEIIPQVGCQVASYTATEIADFFSMFGGIEGSIASAAAIRATREQLNELRRISDQIAQLRDLTDSSQRSQAYLSLNREFHATIYAMADSRIMTELSQRMHDLSDFLINTSGVPGALSGALNDRHDDHERIIEALTQGDAEMARSLTHAHIATTAHITHHE